MPIFIKQPSSPLAQQAATARILFVHIPKTGGTSITRMAIDNGWHMPQAPSNRYCHATYKMYRHWNYDAAFTVIREPVERMRSLLAFKRIPRAMAHEWLASSFRRYHKTHDVFIAPQTEYLGPGVDVAHYGHEDPILIKHFGTSERRIVRPAPVPKYQLEPRTVDLIKDFYAPDYEAFFSKALSPSKGLAHQPACGRSRSGGPVRAGLVSALPKTAKGGPING